MNGSVPPANSRLIYEAELSLHTGIVPDGIKEMHIHIKISPLCDQPSVRSEMKP
jgi:hypothetical protein